MASCCTWPLKPELERSFLLPVPICLLLNPQPSSSAPSAFHRYLREGPFFFISADCKERHHVALLRENHCLPAFPHAAPRGLVRLRAGGAPIPVGPLLCSRASSANSEQLCTSRWWASGRGPVREGRPAGAPPPTKDLTTQTIPFKMLSYPRNRCLWQGPGASTRPETISS